MLNLISCKVGSISVYNSHWETPPYLDSLSLKNRFLKFVSVVPSADYFHLYIQWEPTQWHFTRHWNSCWGPKPNPLPLLEGCVPYTRQEIHWSEKQFDLLLLFRLQRCVLEQPHHPDSKYGFTEEEWNWPKLQLCATYMYSHQGRPHDWLLSNPHWEAGRAGKNHKLCFPSFTVF